MHSITSPKPKEILERLTLKEKVVEVYAVAYTLLKN